MYFSLAPFKYIAFGSACKFKVIKSYEIPGQSLERPSSVFCARHYEIENFRPLYINTTKTPSSDFDRGSIPFSWNVTTINSTENLTGVLEEDESFETVNRGLATRPYWHL